ncbi:ATP-binding cassette domain-containing protein [Mesorhizobium sp. M7A.F.Ca.US.007.01.1.1]|uniref:ATP-binding cassette domain-containing protein n=1 Tax=Mesorhizobium sp. M7A.F.Ca.US.007.01.1.1 TaxID=2496712 RepID=UPI000FCC39CF|nr:ATP-binding cassette domain-containing protein [Mesorhizobium sp. M7A.F.Ca.US.007.01.1.1]RUZ54511.1 ATP-binding cassette domain-containing protein [Mesorhizobium sp. M7A.F.Ca.US.007.01.1.1]
MRAAQSDLPLVFDDVSLIAGATTILQRVNLTIGPHAPTVIVGPNGSGKTSLLRLCMGLTVPSAGTLTWGGRTLSPKTRRAILFQKPVMLRRSVAANVAYGLATAGCPRRLRAARTEELLDRVGLLDLAARPARHLSGGEQQRLALARALARRPEILLLDEPTASLDPAATRFVEQIIITAAQSGTKIIMASHHLGQVRRIAGDVVFLVRGRVCEHAVAGDFLDRPATRQAAAFVRGELVL